MPWVVSLSVPSVGCDSLLVLGPCGFAWLCLCLGAPNLGFVAQSVKVDHGHRVYVVRLSLRDESLAPELCSPTGGLWGVLSEARSRIGVPTLCLSRLVY